MFTERFYLVNQNERDLKTKYLGFIQLLTSFGFYFIGGFRHYRFLRYDRKYYFYSLNRIFQENMSIKRRV